MLDSIKGLGLLLSDLIREMSQEIWEAVRSLYDWSELVAFLGFFRITCGVEDFPCRGTARLQLPTCCMLDPQGEKPPQGEMASDERQREARMEGLPSNPSAPVLFKVPTEFDVDSCSRDKADSKLCSPKNFLSNSDGEEHSKFFTSTKGNTLNRDSSQSDVKQAALNTILLTFEDKRFLHCVQGGCKWFIQLQVSFSCWLIEAAGRGGADRKSVV